MNIAFADGSRLAQDARREDPLFYYVRAADWSDAVGFIVLPEYAEHTARSVTLQVYPPHASRIRAMIDTDVDLMAIRVIAALSEHFKHWVDLQIDWQGCGLGHLGRDAFARAAVQAGWLPASEDADGALHFMRRRGCIKESTWRACVKLIALTCVIGCSGTTSPAPHDGLYHLRTYNGAPIPALLNGEFVESGDLSLTGESGQTSETYVDSSASTGLLRYMTISRFTLRQIDASRLALDPSGNATLGTPIDTLIVRGDTMETRRRRGTVSTEIIVRTYVR